MTGGFLELTFVVLTAATLGLIARLIKQPIILAYIATGLIAAIVRSFYPVNTDGDLFKIFSQLGIMFLLFMIGLEIDYVSLRLVGRTSLIVGLSQIFFTLLVGFAIAALFHFGLLQSGYIAAALTFSSTAIVVKLLSEKKDIHSLYGKITVGLLLVQDFLAILILVILSGISQGNGLIAQNAVFILLKGLILAGLLFWLGRKILPLAFDRIADSKEMLFLGTLAWCLGVAALTIKTGFSVEIGGFLAGLSLANTAQKFSIGDRIRPLRDFFILIFFVILGSELALANLSSIALPVIVFSVFVLIGNPLIVFTIMGLLGYRRRTSFLCGLCVAQISEFSLILAALGFKLGHLMSRNVSLITAVGIITITLSSYMILWNEELYRYFKKYLKIFERGVKKEEGAMPAEFNKPFILIGAHRVGQNIAASLPKKELLIIDFDPEIVSRLRKQGYTCLFGDASDAEVLDKSNLKNSKLIISTSPDLEDNLRILDELGPQKERPKVILRAEEERDALLFYDKGADYVIVPHFTSGQYLGRSIAVDPELKILDELRRKDLETIKKLKTGLIPGHRKTPLVLR